MSIKVSLSSDGLEELFTPPTLKEMCLYKCWTTKEILTKEVEVDEATNGSEKLDWVKCRLREPLQKDLVEALLDAGDEFLFRLTPKYEPVLAAIRMSQPEHLVKVHVNNTETLVDRQLEFLLSGGNVKSLDIHGCKSLRRGSLDAINKFGGKLEYLRIGDPTTYPSSVLPRPNPYILSESEALLRTPKLKTFILTNAGSAPDTTEYWRRLLLDFITNLEHLQISESGPFTTFDFLEPAKSKLSFLSLRNCSLKGPDACAFLFKLDKLKNLDLVGTSFGKDSMWENVVQRLLTALPNLTSLAVNPGLVKDLHVDTRIRGQGSVAIKRLEFLGVMENDEAELKTAKVLASEVAHFGTFEGELRNLEYFSNQLYCSFSYTGKRLFTRLLEVAGTPPWNSVTVIDLLLKIIKSNGINDGRRLLLPILIKLLTTDVTAKLDDVRLNNCMELIFRLLRLFSWDCGIEMSEFIVGAIDIMANLDGKLCLHHYANLVPLLMKMAENAMVMPGSSSLSLHLHNSRIGMEGYKRFLRKIAQLLEKAVDRFPEEMNAWGISSYLGVIEKLKDVIIFSWRDGTVHLLEVFSDMIASLRKVCLNSGPRSARWVSIITDLLIEIINGSLVGLADRDSFALFEILKTIVQDPRAGRDLWEFQLIAPCLENLLLSVHSRWKRFSQTDTKATLSMQQESIISLLNYLESDPSFRYKAKSK